MTWDHITHYKQLIPQLIPIIIPFFERRTNLIVPVPGYIKKV